MKKRGKAGFTLIEAMVLVAVVGILVAIAIPNYSRYVTRGHLVEAGDAFAEFRIRMEQFYRTTAHMRSQGHAAMRLPTNWMLSRLRARLPRAAKLSPQRQLAQGARPGSSTQSIKTTCARR